MDVGTFDDRLDDDLDDDPDEEDELDEDDDVDEDDEEDDEDVETWQVSEAIPPAKVRPLLDFGHRTA